MTRTSRQFPGLVDQDWRSLAACRSADPDLFFPISSSGQSMVQVAEAKAVCAGCRVRRECLAFALRSHQVHGVWGGLSEQERYLLRSATRFVDTGRFALETRVEEIAAAIGEFLTR